MYLPAVDDERTTLRNYLEMQLDAVRDAGYGLDDEQFRETPLRSSLSVAGIIKHVAWCMAGALNASGQLDDSPIDLADYFGAFTMGDGESGDSLRATYEDVKAKYLVMIEHTDLDAVITAPPAPWYGLPGGNGVALRYLVVHHVEEFARHAGHADIIREQIDGATAAALNAAVEGRAANEFVTP